MDSNGISLTSDSGARIDSFGAQFTAPEGTNPLAYLRQFTLEGAVPALWTGWGHTSSDNLPSWAGNSSDPTVKRTYLRLGVATLPGEDILALETALAQSDPATLQAMSEIAGEKVSLFWLFMSGADRSAWWVPSATPTISQQPTPSLENFTETKTKWTFNSPPVGIDLAALQRTTPGTAILPCLTNPRYMVIGQDAFTTGA